MAARRGPLAVLAIALAVAAGVYLAVQLIARNVVATAGTLRPDLNLIEVAPPDLARHGFVLTGREPKSWSRISLRQIQDDRGSLTALRCTIAADEVPALLRWPPGSQRPVVDAAPDWWRQRSPFPVPEWFQPAGTQSRLYSASGAAGSAGLFANYDPATRLLHFWQWDSRGADSGSASAATVAAAPADADDLAAEIEQFLRRRSHPVGADGWLRCELAADPLVSAACPSLPVGAAVRAALYPWKDRHRYLLGVVGIDAGPAAALVEGRPLRQVTAADITKPWAFALPPGGAPSWLRAVGGQAHCLLVPGPGTVESGRWTAYEPHTRTLLVWDWAELTPRPPSADLCAPAAIAH
ncbi:hypothetical protein LBMAG53_02830 [Planctomycetota bacterium]|nr:hypothetical protein LBMAG53_02830 [Planctomycetota bacterium]